MIQVAGDDELAAEVGRLLSRIARKDPALARKLVRDLDDLADAEEKKSALVIKIG